MNVKRPIIIVSVGRSGSTVFLEMLSKHPQVAWLSVVSERFPKRPEWNRRLMRVLDIPGFGKFLQRRLRPAECYSFWETHQKGFRRPCRDLTEKDVTERTRRVLPKTFSRILTERRDRLLVKITGWPRIGFLKEVFPDAIFIHILRDGRDVVNSILDVDFWEGWRGPQNWRWGLLSEEHQEEWCKHERSFVALAAIEWKMLMAATEHAKQCLGPGQFTEVRFEELCREPVNTLRDVAAFCELPWLDVFERRIRRFEMRDVNAKWRRDLTDEQQHVLLDVLGSDLRKYGYMKADQAT